MCKAITKSGKRCKVKGGDYFCHIHAPYVEPTIEEKREAMLQKQFISIQSQEKAWPLFRDIDLTSEALDIIKRAKYVSNWNEETYNTVVSTYFDDSVETIGKYDLIRDKICEGIRLSPTEDKLKLIQRVELFRDTSLLYIKFALSRGIFWRGLEDAKRYYNYQVLPTRQKVINKYHEDNLNKLRVNIVKKYTPICDDVCNYIIAKYL